jgi:uncharacterized protein
MISCDTNILFASLDSSSRYQPAASLFLGSMMDSDRFGLCELVLLELYGLLRNPVLASAASGAAEAAGIIQHFRSHPRWLVFDYPGPEAGIMRQLWQRAAQPAFPYKRVYDARLALTLRHHGVTEFATSNVKDFEGFGFQRVWDPLRAGTRR